MANIMDDLTKAKLEKIHSQLREAKELADNHNFLTSHGIVDDGIDLSIYLDDLVHDLRTLLDKFK